jgi:hypothetical protein
MSPGSRSLIEDSVMPHSCRRLADGRPTEFTAMAHRVPNSRRAQRHWLVFAAIG